MRGVRDSVPAQIRDGLRTCTRWMRDLLERERVARTRPWVEALRRQRRAERRSLVLLLGLLDAQQRREFRECRFFHVKGAASGERYRIRLNMVANIDVLNEDGRPRYRLCVRPAGEVPVYDVMAAQLLYLQEPQAERSLLKQANILAPLMSVVPIG